MNKRDVTGNSLRWWKPSNPYSPVPIPDSEIMMEN